MLQKKNDLMAAINSLNRLICYQERRKYQACRVASSFNCLIKQNVLLRVLLPHWTLQRGRLLPLTDGLLPLCCPRLLPSEEVSSPKTINIKQYLNTSNFTVNNRHFVIKSSQASQLDITKVFYREFNFHEN
jgi:hypothetical protein